MGKPLCCRLGYHSWGEETPLTNVYHARACMRPGCGVRQAKRFEDTTWSEVKDRPPGYIPMPKVKPPRGIMGNHLAAGVSLNQLSLQAQMNIGAGTGSGDTVTRVLRIKKTTRCVWLDEHGLVVGESDQAAPTGLTPDEQGKPG